MGSTLFGPAQRPALLTLLLSVSCAYIGDEREQQRLDADGDGLLFHEDCDDDDAEIGAAAAWYGDGDGDGLGDVGAPASACSQPEGHVADASDCDDGDPDVLGPTTWYIDVDGDHYGVETSSVDSCSQPSGYAGDAGDCDDADDAIHPAADELCNGVDDDCDEQLDEDDAIDADTWYADADGDGYGDPDSPRSACECPAGHVADSGDCDDGEPLAYPGREESCDHIDNDCDDSVDEGVTTSFYLDSDSDGYGDTDQVVEDCTVPSGHAALGGDCDDGEASVNPGEAEVCNDVDDDCDGDTDEDDAIDAPTWYLDSDGDGWGISTDSLPACESPSGYAAEPDDCDDADAEINPGATELCNDLDDDCDSLTDDEDGDLVDAGTWYLDADGDGYGDPTSWVVLCDSPTGYGADSSDCDDGDAEISPGADELCDGVDNDCDGDTDEDEAVDAITWYFDGDGDGYGDAASTHAACSLPSGYTADDSDCDDGDALVYPGASEILDWVDNDCDGTLDNVSLSAADAMLLGRFTYDGAGSRMDGAGDVNSDGYPDLLVASPYEDSNGSNSGAVYLALGPFSGSMDLGSAQAEFLGTGEGDQLGYGLSGGQDADGDGALDLLVGAPWESSGEEDAGAAYLFSDMAAASGSYDADQADVVIWGVAYDDGVGRGVGLLGDSDGDGACDLLVGSSSAGVFLFNGPVSGELSVDDADAVLDGEETGDQAGAYIVAPGDISGDGLADMIIGAPRYDGSYDNSGALYVLWGPITGDMELVDADASIRGVQDHEGIGDVFSTADDVDGDGYTDIAVGTSGVTVSRASDGAAYLFLGRLGGGMSPFSATAKVVGTAAYQGVGSAVSGAGDVDGDGYGELLVGANGDTHAGPYAGAAFMFVGPISGTHLVSNADVRLNGESVGDLAGGNLLGPGDLDLDGLDDFLVTSSYNSRGGSSSGTVYLFFGY